MKTFKSTVKRVTAMVMALALLWTLQPAEASAKQSMSKGVDVSKYNGGVDWNQAKAAGIEYAFIKVGSTYSGIDPNFAANITGAQAAGIKTGVYIYSYATTPEAAVQEANLVLEWISNYTVNFPIVFDIEDKCHKNLSQEQLIAIINSFCMTIDAAGYYPMVYSYKNFFDGKLNICGWDRWVAHYSDSCGATNNVCFWQYTSKGKVPGFNGNVDLNHQYKDYSSLIIPEGFIDHNGNTRFYSNWRMQRGWVNYNDTRYYLDGAGNMVRGWFTDASGTYYLSPADGSIARGQCVVDGADFYFTAEGVKLSGWVVLGDQKFYYDAANNGIMKREWMSDAEGKFYYFDKTDGYMYTGAQVVDGAEFLFDANGVRQTGWATLENGTFYYDPVSGAKVRGFLDDANGRHYLAPDDGHMVTGAALIDGKNYLFDEKGSMMTGMVSREDGSYYYDTATGQMVTGWITLGEQTYYANEAGHIVTGVYTIAKQPYYFGADGVLVRNQAVELEGVSYITTPEGILTKVEAALAGEGQPAEETAQPAADTAQPAA